VFQGTFQIGRSLLKKLCFIIGLACLVSSCGGGGSSGELDLKKGVFGPSIWGTPDTFRGAGIVNDRQFLFGGPLARGRNGDVLLQNDKVRIILQKPDRTAGVGMFGGNIIDADRFRPSSEAGQDQFGVIYPLINLSWTANYQSLEIINADFAKGPVVVRATAALDVYDYIQTNIIVPFAKIYQGVDLHFDDQFDDVFDPFDNVPLLRNLARVIVTDYILKQDSDYVILQTHFQNNGEEPIKMPVGDWVNGSGTVELFVPKEGFVAKAKIDNAPSLIYQAMEDDVDVSYGYFYNVVEHVKEDGALPGAAALSVSGVTPMVLGESTLTNVVTLGGDPKINFKIDPGVRTVTRYFVVGTGDVASVLKGGFEALGVSKVEMKGMVTDSNGQAVPRARVIVLDEEKPINVAFSDAQGNFSMYLPDGSDAKSKLFGSGHYTVQVYKEGYHLSGGAKSGKCGGGSFDPAMKVVTGVQCQLGGSGIVTVSAEVDGGPGPVRVTVVGFDPSPSHEAGKLQDTGLYRDVSIEQRPYGIVDVLYLDPSGHLFPVGNQRRVSTNSFRLEPGEYAIYFTRGPEYSRDFKRITVSSGGAVTVKGSVHKVLDTSGYVSGDFHVHSIQSPDSPFRAESRLRNAMAEGLDVMVNTDHEYVTDLSAASFDLGYQDEILTIPGDEITPLAIGHMITWPLTPNPERPDNGAYDYTFVAGDDILSPGHDMVQGISQILKGVDDANPGTQVLSIPHITDKALGNFAISRLVTTKAFDGVQPLSSFSDPVNFRLPANTHSGGGFQGPFPFGTSTLFSMSFTSVGLTISTFPDMLAHLMETSLPTYFNLLNLGKICSATADSDTHAQIREPVGIPRNFVASSVDPSDGVGRFQEINPEELAVNVNAGKIIVTNGVFVRARLTSPTNSGGVTVGETLTGSGEVALHLEVTSTEDFDWDTVEIYANTEPVPAKDDMSGVTDLSAEEFHSHSNSHLPKYLMAPLFSYHKGVSGEGALHQTVSGGVRKAQISKNFSFSEDTWIVVVVRGTSAVRSAFPYVTKEADVEVDPGDFLDKLETDPASIGGIPAFAFTNPMFVDVDGNGFESLYIRDGTSPLSP
jgi:hypothetical protein